MNAITNYRRPCPHYGLKELASSAWRCKTGWEFVGRAWQRWYGRAAGWRGCTLRRAEVRRDAGAWTWRVIERSPKGVEREIARHDPCSPRPHFVAQQAMPFAELAARQP